MAHKMTEALRTDVFLYSIFGSVMNSLEHELQTKFLKMKPPSSHGTEFEDVLVHY